jgi:serine/threonine protein phosphatase PrpC
MSGAVATACPACGAPIEPADEFCEACGAPLKAGPPGGCPRCRAPAGAIDGDGYCTRCGLRQRRARDHREVDLRLAAGVTDRGLRHHQNEDAMFLAATRDGSIVAVVCDGVSASAEPDAAARGAADAAGQVLVAAVEGNAGDLGDATRDGINAAQAAVIKVPWTAPGDLPSPACTFVSALWRGDTITVGSVGDSRAYWLNGRGSRRLTMDDSWAEEQIQAGALTEAEAGRDPRAHALTRWLGADAPPGDPRVMQFTPQRQGRLLLCSDGLWNYLPTAAGLAELLEAQPAGAGSLAIARAFTEYALAGGGHDNITVVITTETTDPQLRGAT